MKKDVGVAPILSNKDVSEVSVFLPEALLREARRQKGLELWPVPSVCILDPDGDIVRLLTKQRRLTISPHWPCYHTDLGVFTLAGHSVGIVARAVGAPFAVLVAEELFASGCKLLISITSAGQIQSAGTPPYFVVIDRALRDEGTSYHYVAPTEFSEANPELVRKATALLAGKEPHVVVGSSWTTDAPFRETKTAITVAQRKGVVAVEMEAAALYAFAQACGLDVLCLAFVTNAMGVQDVDFEKGEDDGAQAALELLGRLVAGLSGSNGR